MTNVRVSQGDVSYVFGTNTLPLRLSQFDAAVVYNFPTPFLMVSQVDTTAVTVSSNVPVRVSQMDVVAVYSGRVFDPAVRAWTFTLDGHDFYVLRLGNRETLVFDLSTEQWYVWGTGDESLWLAYTGINWIGGNNYASQFGSNVIVGADSNGSLFFLNPDRDVDSSAVTGRDPQPFTRIVTTQVPMRGYDQASVYEVQLIGSTGQLTNNALTEIELLYSDDRGDNYVSAGVVTIEDGDLEARANWLSLGSFRAPGRLFRIRDTGSLRRIDSLTMNSDLSE